MKNICHLCEKLNSVTSQEKTYENINDWWKKQVCVFKAKHLSLKKLIELNMFINQFLSNKRIKPCTLGLNKKLDS